MTPHEFIAKWKPAELKERAACQEHFLDLCRMLGQKTPAEADPKGTWYTFEYGVQKDIGGQGFADVWKKDHFGWEYKGKRKNLVDAYRQLLLYRDNLGNPPLLVVCDLNRFELYTNFTGTIKEVHAFDLDGLADPKNVELLRRCFVEPGLLKPGRTQKQVTEEVAAKFAFVAKAMQNRGEDPHRTGHFLMKVMFCMFAEDIGGLLPENLFLNTLLQAKNNSRRLSQMLADLFAKMAKGGFYGTEEILHFNGGLFNDAEVIDLATDEIGQLVEAAKQDWSNVEPSIFGTLFERILNPSKRSQLGAHYTSKDDILTLLRPVMEAPLRREWAAVNAEVDKLWEPKASAKTKKQINKLLSDFHGRLQDATVLDPACGSGNFLYVALHLLLDLEKEVRIYAETRGLHLLNLVGPHQLHGIELNPYAQELAQVVIWIGYLQWTKFNGHPFDKTPVLDSMDNIENRDAILDLTDAENPTEPEWPEAEFIVGNPPFLGGKLLRRGLGDGYVDAMFKIWDKRVRPEADLCVYWFEKARAMIVKQQVKRAGLLATQGIRGGANRNTLANIKSSGDIFFAVSDKQWILDGANVRISIVGFDDGSERLRQLDAKIVQVINADLSSHSDTTSALILSDNAGVSFMGDTKGGPFDIDERTAIKILRSPNVHGRSSSEVIVPWCNGLDITRRDRNMWIVDFGTDADESSASLYESAFEHVKTHVYPDRQSNKREAYRLKWWLHVEARSGMRRSLGPLYRFIAMPRVAKHLLFVWFTSPTLPDSQIIVFARSDDYCFGLLHSRLHRVWALQMGTRLEDRPRYTPTTCFETFPFPEPTEKQREAIAAAAKELDTLRNNWLNPPE